MRPRQCRSTPERTCSREQHLQLSLPLPQGHCMRPRRTPPPRSRTAPQGRGPAAPLSRALDQAGGRPLCRGPPAPLAAACSLVSRSACGAAARQPAQLPGCQAPVQARCMALGGGPPVQPAAAHSLAGCHGCCDALHRPAQVPLVLRKAARRIAVRLRYLSRWRVLEIRQCGRGPPAPLGAAHNPGACSG